MKKIFILLLFLLCPFYLSCNNLNNNIEINYSEIVNEFSVGQTMSLRKQLNGYTVTYYSHNPNVAIIDGYLCKAISKGETIIEARNLSGNTLKKYLIKVLDDNDIELKINGEKVLKVGSSTTLYINNNISPDNIIWHSNNQDVAIVKDGLVTAISEGLVTIKVSLKNNSSNYATYQMRVLKNDEDYTIENQYQESKKEIDLTTLNGVLEPIINKTKNSVVGINSYYKIFGQTRLLNTGSALIYKRIEITNEESKIVDYKYYAITAKSVCNNATNIEVYYDEEVIDAEVIALEQKVDIGVITFTSKKYFQVATFADSDAVQTGEFVIALGNSFGKDYQDCASFGIVSYNLRYVNTDTDNDGIKDWDAMYLQHDAAIGPGSSGGPLVNMKGEVIGINSITISDARIDNMAFAIPSNLVLDLVSLLEQGIVPTRPLLLISIVSVKEILNNDYLLQYYPLPSNCLNGFYVAEVTEGGVGALAGMQIGDVIVEFDGQKLNYTYELRMKLNEVIVGANEEHYIVVNRNGNLITLKVVF